MSFVHTNRLADETSPYLLQHAHNPVDWYPWGREAFEAARRENKPIFLSVGYSTCYWCHVMERQCFEDEAIAREMNWRFINVKVDREERPDVDQLYMNAVQVLTRHGGWPMSVFLTPDLKPFYGGTYFPPNDSHGRPGFPTILRAIEDAYRNRRDEVEKSANQLVDILQQLAEPGGSSRKMVINERFIDQLVNRSAADYDPEHGGFGSAPKFPRETLLELMLVHQRHAPDERRMKMIRHTLDALANGGIRDHLGGGFHRYSTDAQWLVPHFEIMLYDNAMLAWCYVEAYRQTEELRYATVARGVFDFVLREMTSPQGAFYTAFDAEVDAQEGLNYLWTPAEVEAVLGKEDAARFGRVYGLDLGPNFADPHHGTGRPDKNILYLPHGPAEESLPAVVALRQKLYEARKQRKQPLLDTKILTSWNALMIRALAYGGRLLAEPRYLAAAEAAASYLLQHHQGEDGTLYRTSRDGSKPKYAGFLDDYAFLAWAMTSLHDAGADQKWKDQASALTTAMRRRFEDESSGGFFFNDREATDLIVRQKTASDSPLPSGNAAAAMVLLELGEADAARRTIERFAAHLDQQAEGMSSMVEAALLYIRRHGELTIEPAADSEERVLSPQELATRVVSIGADWRNDRELAIHLRILSGFHLQANPAAPGLIATELMAREDPGANVEYPPPQMRTFAFAEAPVPVYEGDVAITVRFPSARQGGRNLQLALRYQACDESACLPTMTKQFEIRSG